MGTRLRSIFCRRTGRGDSPTPKARGQLRTEARREGTRRQAPRRIIPAGPPAQRLPGQPDQLIGRDRQSRRARPGSQHQLGERELSHFLAVAVDLELAPLAAGTNAEVVDLVGAAVVLEGGDGLAGAGGVFRGPQGTTFLALAHVGLWHGRHRSVLCALARGQLVAAPVPLDLIHHGGHVLPGVAGPKVRIDERAPPSRAGTDVLAALLKPVQGLAIAKPEGCLHACAFLDLGKIQHSIDQARAAPWRDVPRLGVQRHPGGASRSFGGGHLGRGDRAVIIADLDVLTQIRPRHAMPPAANSRNGPGRELPGGYSWASRPFYWLICWGACTG